jgi:hypothetical protein
MEAMLGISLYSFLYLKLAKTLCLSYYLLCFLFNKIGEQEGGTASAWKQGSQEVAQIKLKLKKRNYKKNKKQKNPNHFHSL